jgi:hypothetical protein
MHENAVIKARHSEWKDECSVNHDQAKSGKSAHDKKPDYRATAPESQFSAEPAPNVSESADLPEKALRQPHDILQLQRAIGNRAVQRMIGQQQAIQRALQVTAETLPTPAGQVKRLTGASNIKKDLSLPGGRVEDTDRPREVKTTVTNATLRPGEREKDSILSVVTGMARDEQKVLKGVATNKYFDAGHLIADELVAGDPTVGEDGSFVYGNLAPQQSTFNQVSYRVFEGKIRRWAEWGNTVEVTTTLTYEGDYTVTNQELTDNGVVKNPIPSTNLANATAIPRRVPQTWKIHARIVGYKRGPKSSITEGQKRNKFTQGINYADALPNSAVPAGTGHKFKLGKESLKSGTGQPLSKPTDSPAIAQGKDPANNTDSVVKEKEMVGKQWTPTNNPSLDEIMSIIKASYPKLTDGELRYLLNEGKFLINISRVDDLLDIKEPTLEQIFLKYQTDVQPNATIPQSLEEADQCCNVLKKWLTDERQDIQNERETLKGVLSTTQDYVKLAATGSLYLETLEAFLTVEKSIRVIESEQLNILRQHLDILKSQQVSQLDKGQKRTTSDAGNDDPVGRVLRRFGNPGGQ